MLLEAETNKYCPGYDIGAISNLITWVLNFFFSVHAKIVYRKLEKNIPRRETARPQFQFLNSYICERFIYSISTIGLPIWLQQNRWTDPGN
jgi:hypothetical protein